MAILVFMDPYRVIFKDEKHSLFEVRMFCIGKVGDKIITTRFTYRNNIIRIIGAGVWRKEIKIYEKENLSKR